MFGWRRRAFAGSGAWEGSVKKPALSFRLQKPKTLTSDFEAANDFELGKICLAIILDFFIHWQAIFFEAPATTT